MSRETKEVQEALQTVSQALAPLKEHKTVTWLLDSGFDDVAVWRTIWEQQEHVVLRIYHTERKVAFQDRQGEWHEGDIAQAKAHLRRLARVETTMEVKRGKRGRPASLGCIANAGLWRASLNFLKPVWAGESV